jgi:hypothetical protein
MKKTIFILSAILLLSSCSKVENKSNLSFIFKSNPIQLINIKTSIIMSKAFIYGKVSNDTSITYSIVQLDNNTVHVYSSRFRSNDMNNEDFLNGKVNINGNNIIIDAKSNIGSSVYLSL